MSPASWVGVSRSRFPGNQGLCACPHSAPPMCLLLPAVTHSIRVHPHRGAGDPVPVSCGFVLPPHCPVGSRTLILCPVRLGSRHSILWGQGSSPCPHVLWACGSSSVLYGGVCWTLHLEQVTLKLHHTGSQKGCGSVPDTGSSPWVWKERDMVAPAAHSCSSLSFEDVAFQP